MTNDQLYLAIGVPIVVNILFNGFMFIVLNNRISTMEASLKELWRAELHRVEEVLDARLKHLEHG